MMPQLLVERRRRCGYFWDEKMVNGGDNDSDCEEEDDTMLNHGRRIAVLVEVLLQWEPLLETPRQDSLFWRVNRTTQRKCRRHDA